MANVRRGNTWYLDTSASLETGKNIRVLAVIFTPNASGQSLAISDDDGSSQYNKVTIKGTAQYDTKYYDFSKAPIVTNGLNVTITSGAVATLILG